MSAQLRTSSGGRGNQGRGQRGGRGNQGRGFGGFKGQGPTASTKFKGNCQELQGYIFDCSDHKQADNFVHSKKRIAEYVGAEYKYGGDIRSSIVHEVKTTITRPTAPTYSATYATAPTADDKVSEMIFKCEIDAYVKRKTTLEDNIQKAYALVLGQCTELLQSKLKQQTSWQNTSQTQDVIELLIMIKAVCFKFEDQKFLPLALYHAKRNVYNINQGNLSCHAYLERFRNMVDVVEAYGGHLYDQATLDIITHDVHGVTTDYNTLTDAEQSDVKDLANDLVQATMFVAQADKRRFGPLQEDLENAYTRGNDDYPTDLVLAYQLLNEFKHWTPKTVTTSPDVVFAQNDKNKTEKEDWKKTAKCHGCGELGHIRPDCPKLKKNQVEDEEEQDTKKDKKDESKSKGKTEGQLPTRAHRRVYYR